MIKISERKNIQNFIAIIAFMLSIEYLEAIPRRKLQLPNNYVALSGDFKMKIAIFETNVTLPFVSANIQISALNGNSTEIEIKNIYQHAHYTYSLIDITLDCKYFVHGGLFRIGVILNKLNYTSNNTAHDILTQNIDINWPSAQLIIKSTFIGTYPEYPVEVNLSFTKLQCDFVYFQSEPTIQFLFELIYCNQEATCVNTNITNHHILYAEQVRGYPKLQVFKLHCELFGLAGYYAVRLRSLNPSSSFVPCDPHTGLGVLFEYPSCILDQADRIRLFGKLRADVASLKSPTSLHYVTEKKVVKGQHSLYFDCDFFSEKYVEYCFTYVSQSSSGAVADIRTDCVPTLPVTDSETGGWGPWSNWTQCSKKCVRGTRNRYRFCDSPAPRYGAKFCEGPAVQTEYCGGKEIDTWKCLYGMDTSFIGHNEVQDEAVAEIGPGCRCGCIVHLGSSKPKRVLAATAQSCPGRSFS